LEIAARRVFADEAPVRGPAARGLRRGTFMIDRRAILRLALGAAPTLALLAASAARAEPGFKQFLPFLVDVPGWEGQKASGFTIEGENGAMTTATREYRRGAAHAQVSIIIGPAAEGALSPIASGMKMETPDGHMLPIEIAGLKAMTTYQNSDKSGGIVVALAENAALSFTYDGLAEDEALALAQKLDLKGLQAAAKAK
jgi:hypothetical protein